MNFFKNTFVLLAVSFGLTSCLTSETASLHGEGAGSPPQSWTANNSSFPLPDDHRWISDFSDADSLRKLVNEAQIQNHDLRATAARFKAARARLITETAPLLPQFDSNFDSRRSKRANLRSGQTSASSDSGADNIATQSGGALQNDFEFNLAIAWEIDLWGRLRNDSRAARNEARAAEADLQAARLSLAANTVQAWFDAIEAEQQLQLAVATLRSFEASLKIVEQSYERGIAAESDTALDVRLTRSDVASARSRVAEARRNRDVAGRNLEVFLGRYPADQITIPDNLPSMMTTVPAGMPSELLLRRPDVRAAEFRLAASGERVKSAKKAFLPELRLTGSRGYQSDDLSSLLRPEQIIWNVAAGLAQPLFAGGQRVGLKKTAEAEREAAVETYAQSALVAFQEVESALAAESFLAAQESALKIAANESHEAENLAMSQYEKGLIDIITLLESQRRAFTAASQYLSIQRLRLSSRVDLYLALGGGF